MTKNNDTLSYEERAERSRKAMTVLVDPVGTYEELQRLHWLVEDMYKAGMELHGAILTNHRWFELRDDRLTDAMDDWLETTRDYHEQRKVKHHEGN